MCFLAQSQNSAKTCIHLCVVSDIAIFVLKRDVKLQLTNYSPVLSLSGDL